MSRPTAPVIWPQIAEHSLVRTSNTTLNLDDFTQALVRRNLLSIGKYISGIETGRPGRPQFECSSSEGRA